VRSRRSGALPSERERSIKRHVGVLGGTFDPIHVGHLIIAQEVVAALQLETLYFLPAGDPPHKRDHAITPASHRQRMVELAIAGNPAFALSLIDLERPGPSYTVDTLRLLREQWGPETSIAFVIGWDMLDDLLTWHDPAGVVQQADTLVAIHRPGYHLDPDYLALLEGTVPGIRQRLVPLEAPQIAVSSSDLRQRVATNRPIRYQVPDAVAAYILEHGLYRQPGPVWQDQRRPAPRHIQ
jgi:nicotinate-nucleotide adenylyltransferase